MDQHFQVHIRGWLLLEVTPILLKRDHFRKLYSTRYTYNKAILDNLSTVTESLLTLWLDMHLSIPQHWIIVPFYSFIPSAEESEEAFRQEDFMLTAKPAGQAWTRIRESRHRITRNCSTGARAKQRVEARLKAALKPYSRGAIKADLFQGVWSAQR